MLKYWLWLTNLRGVRNQTRLALLRHFSTPEDVFYADPDELMLTEGITREEIKALGDHRLTAADRILAECQQLGLGILTLQDALLKRTAEHSSAVGVKPHGVGLFAIKKDQCQKNRHNQEQNAKGNEDFESSLVFIIHIEIPFKSVFLIVTHAREEFVNVLLRCRKSELDFVKKRCFFVHIAEEFFQNTKNLVKGEKSAKTTCKREKIVI